ncbi:hypothetical protein [Nitratireductor pacificus]|nr:hypothetical protein [Nitratireductor pacificus]
MTTCTATEEVASSHRPTLDASRWLGLAATPTFAVMAWISATGATGMTMCSAVPAFIPINDMALMYALMSLFHLSPWMKLLSVHLQRPSTETEGD